MAGTAEHFTTGRPMLPQLTLGDLVEDLGALDGELPVHLAGFGIGSAPLALGRHRAHADGLAIHAGVSELPWTVRRLRSALLRRTRPRDPGAYVASFDTPVWVHPAKELQFKAVTAVSEVKGHALISHVDLAPVQGPSLQRLHDEEARDRLYELGDTPEGLPEKAERYLLRMVPGDRAKALVRIREARERIAHLEEQIARDLDTVARADYLLGITDWPPAGLEG